MENKSIKNIIIVIIILILFAGAYIIIKRITSKDGSKYGEYLKNYEANEYIPTYISDEQMSKIYLNDYIHTMYSNIEKAYNSLDEKYRNKKFGSLESYKNYVDLLPYTEYNVSRYYVKEKDEYTIYGVYDNNNNLFIFKTKGVMQYTVFLDDTTVEI